MTARHFLATFYDQLYAGQDIDRYGSEYGAFGSLRRSTSRPAPSRPGLASPAKAPSSSWSARGKHRNPD